MIAEAMGHAVKHFEAERREPSGEFMPQTHRELAPCRYKTTFIGGRMLLSVGQLGISGEIHYDENQLLITVAATSSFSRRALGLASAKRMGRPIGVMISF